jgi:ABC-type xylose transport system permease subunit
MQKVAKELLGMLSWPAIAARLAAAEAAAAPLAAGNLAAVHAAAAAGSSSGAAAGSSAAGMSGALDLEVLRKMMQVSCFELNRSRQQLIEKIIL